MRIDYYPLTANRLILARGKELFLNGSVKYLETLLDGIYFDVITTGHNTVEIRLNNDYEIENIICSCKEFALNKYCKHSIAAVYFYCDMLKIPPQEPQVNSWVVDEVGNIVCNTKNYDFDNNRPKDLNLGYICEEK